MLDLITKNKVNELIKEQIQGASEEMWKEIDRINNKIILIEYDLKIIQNGK